MKNTVFRRGGSVSGSGTLCSGVSVLGDTPQPALTLHIVTQALGIKSVEFVDQFIDQGRSTTLNWLKIVCQPESSALLWLQG